MFYNIISISQYVWRGHAHHDYFHYPREEVLDVFPGRWKQLKLFQNIFLILIIHNNTWFLIPQKP